MRKITTALAIASAVFLSACAPPNEPDPVGTEIPVERLRSDPYSFATLSGFHGPERLLIRNSFEWVKAWSTIHQDRPTPPLPDIDFTKNMIVVAALGDRPSSGYNILVKGASRAAEATIVSLEITSPGPGCAVLAVITQPVDVATIPRSAALVQFEETAIVTNCR